LRGDCKKMPTKISIAVIEARELWPTSKQGTCDAQAQLGLWTRNPSCPHVNKVLHKVEIKGKRSYHSTATKERTVSPKWDEGKTFELADLGATLDDIDLIVEVWEGDKTFLGWLDIELKPLFDGEPHDVWYPLRKRKAADKVSGELRLIITIAPPNPLTKIEIVEENCSILPDFIFQTFWNHIYVRELALIKCQISSLVPKVALLRHLQILNLSENSLKTLPDEIFSLTSLHTLDLSKNLFESLDGAKLARLTALKLLNVKYNPGLKDFSFATSLPAGCVLQKSTEED